MTEKILKCPVCEADVFSHFLNVTDYFLTKEEFTIKQCDTCGFRFIDPRPDKNDIGRYYQSDEYISHDAKKPDFISRIYKLARVFSVKNKYNIVRKYAPTGKILDIGCGTGEFLNYCSTRGYEVVGIEPNEKASAFAQKVNGVPACYPNLSDLASAKGSFDCITMWHVLEHVHDLNETLELVKSLLDPAGIFIIAVPNCNSWDAGEYGKFWAAYDVPRHLYHFVGTTLEHLVSNHGFEIRKTIPQKLDSFYVSMLSEKYRSGKNNYLKSLIFGFWSNFQAGKQGRGHSSRIFVLSLKKA
jgi:2-polyprenyl-3-methyl-5-hydroxy-6-metoxy-1,4-benzoquinol methylase